MQPSANLRSFSLKHYNLLDHMDHTIGSRNLKMDGQLELRERLCLFLVKKRLGYPFQIRFISNRLLLMMLLMKIL